MNATISHAFFLGHPSDAPFKKEFDVPIIKKIPGFPQARNRENSQVSKKLDLCMEWAAELNDIERGIDEIRTGMAGENHLNLTPLVMRMRALARSMEAGR